MTTLPGKPVSFWLDSTAKTTYPQMENVTVDVAIVGAGITGITAAYLLKKAGKKVALIEGQHIAASASGHTTAKVTSLHQLIYAELIDRHGEDKARLYGESNQAGVEFIASTVEQEGIDCDFQRNDTYSFAEDKNNLDKVQKEYDAAVKLGLPAEFVTDTTLPFDIAGAVKFNNQAQFHVRKYLLHLADLIPGDGSYVFENSRVKTAEEGTPCKVFTDNATLLANDVLLTTHLPIMDQGLFFAKTYPQRSYIIGAKINSAKAPEGMYIGVGNNYYSIRTTPTEGKDLLLMIGGGSHKVGEKSETEESYQELERYAHSHFEIDKIDYRWSSQDYESFDQLPFIGKLTPANDRIYVATGYSLWGMSKGTMAGMILSDLVQGIANPWVDLYDSLRATPFVTKESMKNNLDVGMHWVGDRLKGLTSWSTDDVKPGEGKLINYKGETVGVYKDETGKVTAVNATCPHLGCIVNWNSAEKSWDCPCHGGRFTCEGKIIQSPATKDLEVKTLS
ncbi:FAD-dependent oxidoreductase [Waterburya agarophytonicola K14]|uniref:FAD-dependent oxidoreductase n=1 Tax=Waterburya agarophytonicola KI4 TaxID=2874699 RepID=A0A964BPJ2_9CYAN|nr:FAD-dependent oxidoreductase [Waterburya agarophytonicola]MCC0176436.1 FAD-dependent oxidoreductase [Waterburya agarophytonicola KI4]